jgi:uncharacterized cupin superfamily protein
VSLETVNVADLELDEPLDEAGFRHVAAPVGPRLGARRIGATIYTAEPGTPIWPYHYHHGVEEWLYVISGSPTLRDPGGERVLAAGDLVAFPSGPSGAHSVRGPGRILIFSGMPAAAEASVAIYPDSDKVGVRPRGGGSDRLNFRRDDAVDY